MGDFLNLWDIRKIYFPPNQEPRERPSIKTERITDMTGVITPKFEKANRIQIIWYSKLQNPDMKNMTNNKLSGNILNFLSIGDDVMR